MTVSTITSSFSISDKGMSKDVTHTPTWIAQKLQQMITIKFHQRWFFHKLVFFCSFFKAIPLHCNINTNNCLFSLYCKINWASFIMWTFIVVRFWHCGSLSWVEGHPWLPFLMMSWYTFFKWVVNNHFVTKVSLHSPILQDQLEPSLTHSKPFLAIWRRGKASKNNITRVVGGISSSQASSKTLALPSPSMDSKLESTKDAKNKKIFEL